MEFDDIGGRCEQPSCLVHDYLIYRCDSCNRAFCHEHRTYESHECKVGLHMRSKQQTVECPFCSRPFVVKTPEDIDTIVSQHIDKGCPKRKRAFKKCSFLECSVRDPVAVLCKQCKLHYCLEHRLESDHNCKVQTTVAAPRKPQQSRDDQKVAPLGRNHIAKEQRFYFRVYFPGHFDRKGSSMFFSKTMTVGKMIDEIFELGKIPIPSEAGSPRPGVYCARRTGSVNLLPYMSTLSELESQKVLAQNDSIVLADPNTNPLSLSLYAPAAVPVQPQGKARKATTSGQHKQKKRPCVIM